MGWLPRLADDVGGGTDDDAGAASVVVPVVVVVGSSVADFPLLSSMLRILPSQLLLPPSSLPTSPKFVSIEEEPSVNNDVDDETSPLIFI